MDFSKGLKLNFCCQIDDEKIKDCAKESGITYRNLGAHEIQSKYRFGMF